MYYEKYTTKTVKCIEKTGNNSEFRISESSSSYEEIALKIINIIENLSIYNSIEEYNNLQYSINQNANIFESTDVLKKICASLSIINNNENNDPSIYALKNKIISDFNSLKSIIQKIELE